MNPADLFTPSEHRILLGISLLMCIFFYANLANKYIDAFNLQIEREEIRKMNFANDPNYEEFTFYACGGGLRFWETVIQLQLFIDPLVFIFLFYAKTFWNYFFAFLLNSLTFWGFYSWADYSLRYGSDWLRDNRFNAAFGEMFLIRSTALEFYLFLLVSILLVLQLFFMIRFVKEKFNAKLPLA